jgi:hypothetical protein
VVNFVIARTRDINHHLLFVERMTFLMVIFCDIEKFALISPSAPQILLIGVTPVTTGVTGIVFAELTKTKGV